MSENSKMYHTTKEWQLSSVMDAVHDLEALILDVCPDDRLPLPLLMSRTWITYESEKKFKSRLADASVK